MDDLATLTDKSSDCKCSQELTWKSSAGTSTASFSMTILARELGPGTSARGTFRSEHCTCVVVVRMVGSGGSRQVASAVITAIVVAVTVVLMSLG